MYLVITVTVLICGNLSAQSPQKKPLRESAIENFNSGSYQQAYREFSILTATYTRDPLYKYYSARCLIELRRELDKAVSLLQEAVNGTLEIKSIPDDAWFYLGRVQQMSGRFEEAIKSYSHFTQTAGKKAAREMHVSELIDDCKAGKGQVKEAEVLFSDAFENNTDVPAVKEHEKTVEEHEKPLKETVRPTTVRSRPERAVLPEELDRTLSEALLYQVKADSLKALASDHREELRTLPESLRPQAKIRIDELESESARYQKLADERFSISAMGRDLQKDTLPVRSGSLKQVTAVADTAADSLQNITVPESQREIAASGVRKEAVMLEFEIVSDPGMIARQKIETDPQLPPGLIYRIQIAVFSKPVTASIFRGITPIIGFTVPGTSTVKYYAGLFRRSADANKALLQVRQAGFRDAFLNAVSDGKIVSIDRAALLEREWGNKPLYEVQVPEKNIVRESGPPTLSYRVEVTRSDKPLKDDKVEGFRKLSAGRGLEILSTDDGSVVYLIGKFITFESASDYAGLLVRNGYREARVTAYLGNKEIPVETAKQLFEKIK